MNARYGYTRFRHPRSPTRRAPFLVWLCGLSVLAGGAPAQAEDRVWETAWAHSVARVPSHAVVVADAVVLAEDAGRVVALDRKDGRVIWRYEAPSPPVTALAANGSQVIVASGELSVLRANDGVRVAAYPLGCSPGGDCQFRLLWLGGGEALLAGFGAEPTRMNLTDPVNGRRRWASWADVGPIGIAANAPDGFLVAGAGGVDVTSVAAKDGAVRWRSVLPLRDGVAGDAPRRLWFDGARVRVLRAGKTNHGPFRIDSFAMGDGAGVSKVEAFAPDAVALPEPIEAAGLACLERAPGTLEWLLALRSPDDGAVVWSRVLDRSAAAQRVFGADAEVVAVSGGGEDQTVRLQAFHGPSGRSTAYGVVRGAPGLPDGVFVLGRDALVAFRGQVVWQRGSSLERVVADMHAALASGEVLRADPITVQVRDLADHLTIAREAYAKRVRYEMRKARALAERDVWPEALGNAERVIRQAPEGVLGALIPALREWNNLMAERVPPAGPLDPQKYGGASAVAKAIGARLLAGAQRIQDAPQTDRDVLKATTLQTLDMLWRAEQSEAAELLFRTLANARVLGDARGGLPHVAERLLAEMVREHGENARVASENGDSVEAAEEMMELSDLPYLDVLVGGQDSKAWRALTDAALSTRAPRPGAVRRVVDLVQRALGPRRGGPAADRECPEQCARKRVTCVGPCAPLERCDAALQNCLAACEKENVPRWQGATDEPAAAGDAPRVCY